MAKKPAKGGDDSKKKEVEGAILSYLDTKGDIENSIEFAKELGVNH
jgi:hypothetical protein